MECQQIKEMFSLWLDKQISPQEDARLTQHLLNCPACKREFQEWLQISDILKTFGASTENLKAPVGFEEQVMQQIARIEKQPRWFKLNRTVKRFTAVAAAAALLAYGAVDLYPRVLNNPPPVNVAEHQNPDPANPSLNLNNNNNDNNNLPGQSSGASDQPLINGETPDAPVTPGTGNQSGDTIQNGNNGEIVEPLSDVPPPVKNNPDSLSIASVDPANVSPMVFLNIPRTISSHLLRLEVKDLASVQKQAEVAAKAAGAKCQVFSIQSNGENQRVILRITVDNNKANALINSLTQQGNLIESQEDKQDITKKFADTLEQYRTLAAQINDNTDEKQRASLSAQLKSLEQQLTAWDEEAEKQIIMLTLET